mgnify:CR=1 FL=1
MTYNPTAADTYKGYDLHGSPNINGSFNITTFSFFKSFQDGNDPIKSKLFDEFLSDRQDIGKRLHDQNLNNSVKTYISNYYYLTFEE